MVSGNTASSNDIVARFRAIARAGADLPAIELGASSWSYGELDRLSDAIAGRMLDGSAPRGAIAVLDCERGPLLVAAMLACVKARVVFFVVGENQPEAYLGRILDKVQDVFWLGVTGQAVRERGRRIAGERLRGYCVLDGEELGGGADAGEAAPAGAIRPATVAAHGDEVDGMYLVATSGSTGRPKLVFNGMNAVANFIDWYRHTFSLSARDRFSMLSGLGYDPLIRDVFAPLCIGACIVIPPKEVLGSRRGLREWLGAAGVSVIHVTPSLAESIFGASETRALEGVRVVATGGAALTRQLAARIKAQLPGGALVNVYGTSETPQIMSYHVVGEVEGHGGAALVPIGKPISGVAIELLNPEGAAVLAHNEVGEIHVKTPHLSKGYYGLPELTAERFGYCERHGCTTYRTGDLGFRDDAGNLHFLGRRDRQVKYRGHRIQLEVIEKALLDVEGIQSAAVVYDGGRGADPGSAGDLRQSDKLTCYLQYRAGAAHNLLNIKQRLAGALPTYMLPDNYVVLDAMPLTSNGKIDYATLAKAPPSAESMLRVTASVREDRVTEELRTIWSEVLGVPTTDIGLNSNWFDVGGTSLLSARVVEQINKRYTRQLKITDVFVYSTIGDLSEYITRRNDVRAVAGDGLEAGKRTDRLNRISLERNRRVHRKP